MTWFLIIWMWKAAAVIPMASEDACTKAAASYHDTQQARFAAIQCVNVSGDVKEIN